MERCWWQSKEIEEHEQGCLWQETVKLTNKNPFFQFLIGNISF